MDTKLRLGDFICFSLYSASHAFTRIYKPLLERLGLTYPQYLVMVVLWEQDGQTVGGIGEKLFLESSTLTPLLKRLETAGLVKRERNPADERQVLIRLTPEGRDMQQQTADFLQQLVEATGMSVEEIGELRRNIVTLRDNLNRMAGV
ncbi:MarR family winged helix-turn-helix transcriptional regulator [Niveispirillum irakense]|uniref:MarR family winged helix-turn-helix transcriptional regulator n=1 Tax=Niveispirillum irakense TaxID=34011 RepID=UPI0004914649|nr:MarR family transcriptional regulator [Niveispirillum irakense]